MNKIKKEAQRQKAHLLIDFKDEVINNKVFSKDEDKGVVKFNFIPYSVETDLQGTKIMKGKARGYWRVAVFADEDNVEEEDRKQQSNAN